MRGCCGCRGTFGDGVALFEGIEGGGERVEGAELDDLAEPVQVGNGAPNRFGVLPDFVEAVSLEQRVTRSGFVEKEQRHRTLKTEETLTLTLTFDSVVTRRKYRV